MTIELLEKAKELKLELDKVNSEISFLQICLKDERLKYYIVEIREGPSYSSVKLDHHGMLPDFIEAILDKRIANRDALLKKFEEL